MNNNKFDYLNVGRQVINDEVESLKKLPIYLDKKFNFVCELIRNCMGRVIIIGVGQSWHVGRKTACSMSSLGRPAFYMHATEALHGDMGLVTKGDVAIFISSSGETKEILTALESIKRIGIKTIALVSNTDSTLARECDFSLATGVKEEAGPIKFAPSSSALVTIGLCDAIIMAVAMSIGFNEYEYFKFHPGGNIGKELSSKLKE